MIAVTSTAIKAKRNAASKGIRISCVMSSRELPLRSVNRWIRPPYASSETKRRGRRSSLPRNGTTLVAVSRCVREICTSYRPAGVRKILENTARNELEERNVRFGERWNQFAECSAQPNRNADRVTSINCESASNEIEITRITSNSSCSKTAKIRRKKGTASAPHNCTFDTKWAESRNKKPRRMSAAVVVVAAVVVGK